jgi:NAD+ kinase
VLQHVAVLYHPRRKSAVHEAEWLAGQLSRRGVRLTVGNAWDPDTVFRAASCGADLLVALGGDGTIIQVARISAPCGIPLLGINLGRVGFLAELTPRSLRGQVDAVAQGDYWIEERCMLDVEFHDGESSEHFLCLNEAAIARGGFPRAVHVTTLLDGEDFMTYTADAVLVATATGSTAYSLAAGGPIIYPESRDFMITPVAPHLHIGRSMIIPGDTRVSLRLASDRHAVVSVDGSDDRELTPNHTVHVSRSQLSARFARLGPRRYFYSALADRLK